MAGHLLNITITANEALKTANVTVFGITSMMIVNGTTASANMTVDETGPEGDVLFNITAFDLAGNNLTVTQTNLTSSNLTIDNTNPTLLNLTIYSDNHNTSLATLGNTLNITITANENLSSAEIMLLNDTYEMSTNGMVANASVKVDANHADGKVEFNITAFDLAGNSLAVNQTNLNSSNLTIDKNVPGVSNLTLYSNNSNSSLATFTLAFATIPLVLISYVSFRSMISALERFSFAVIVMFRVLPKVASEVLWLSLYMVRFKRVGFVLSIVRFEEVRFVWVTVRLFPARSKAVMLNNTSPSGPVSSTVMFALAVVPFTIIIDVMPNTVTFAVFRASFAVIVMFNR